MAHLYHTLYWELVTPGGGGAIPAAHLYHTLYLEIVTPGGYSSGTSVPYFILGVSYIRELFQRNI